MEIQCKDIYDLMNNITAELKNKKDLTSQIVVNAWEQLTGDACKYNNYTEEICDLVGLLKSKTMSGIVKKYNIDVDALQKMCQQYLTECKAAFCGEEGSGGKIDIKCQQLQNAMTVLFKLYGKDIGDNIQQFCSNMKELTGGDINKLELLVEKELPDELSQAEKDIAVKYIKQLPATMDCLCPGTFSAKPAPPKPKPVMKTKMKWNAATTSMLAGAAALVAIIIVTPILLSRKMPAKPLVAALVVIAILAAVGVALWKNPSNLYWQLVPKDIFWKPIQGEFQGSGSFLGADVSLAAHVGEDNTIALESLGCKGPCPSDLLAPCSDKKLSIDVDHPTSNGYPLSGDCIEKIRTESKAATVEDIYVGQDAQGEVFANVLLSVGGVIPHMIHIELTRK